MSKLYKAKARGYDGVKLREVGETFQFDGKPGKWMEEVGAAKASEPSQPPQDPATKPEPKGKGK